MTRDVDAQVAHRLNGVRVHLGRLRPGAQHLDVLTENGSRKALGHLAAGGIRDAQKENLPGHARS
jgi:hypothetical protein